jgi:hypothetical protein
LRQVYCSPRRRRRPRHDVGNIAFAGEDVTIHGPHDVFDQGEAAFCNALLAVS